MAHGYNFGLQYVIITAKPFAWYEIVPDIMKECEFIIKNENNCKVSRILHITKEMSFDTYITKNTHSELYAKISELSVYLYDYTLIEKKNAVMSEIEEIIKQLNAACDADDAANYTIFLLNESQKKAIQLFTQFIAESDKDNKIGFCGWQFYKYYH